MPILLDKKTVPCPRGQKTIGDILNAVLSTLPENRVLVQIDLDGASLDSQGQADARPLPLGQSVLTLATADRKDLSLTTLGKIAALIEWLAPQHQQVALLLERGETAQGLERLGGLLQAWQRIQEAYANLAKLVGITMSELRVRDLNGEAVLAEFCHQLGEVQSALQNQDFVMLADILQYEMDGAVANWMSLLESTLAIVEPVGVA